jgi:DNA-binding transcriptional regulator YhcF (GntR family)
MILHLRTDSPVPPYEQLRAQIATMVASGVLAPGARLPTIRQLASDLGVAGGTVSRAHRELERDGVITGRGRHGTFVRERPAAAAAHRPDLGARLEEAARWFAVQASQLGADPSVALDRARHALDALAR